MSISAVFQLKNSIFISIKMESYIITERKEHIYCLIGFVLLFLLFLWIHLYLGIDLLREGRTGRGSVLISTVFLIILLLYNIFLSIRYKENIETLKITPYRIIISGDDKSHVDLVWKKIEKIEVINGLTTKLVFHFKYNQKKVKLYSYQRTFKLIKALKHFGNGIDVIEHRKIFKLLYVPFW